MFTFLYFLEQETITISSVITHMEQLTAAVKPVEVTKLPEFSPNITGYSPNMGIMVAETAFNAAPLPVKKNSRYEAPEVIIPPSISVSLSFSVNIYKNTSITVNGITPSR